MDPELGTSTSWTRRVRAHFHGMYTSNIDSQFIAYM